MSDKMKKFVTVILVVCLLLPISVNAQEVDYNKKYEVTLNKCVDGDTAKFTLENGEVYSTRFLAIDTPETVHPTKGVEPYGKEASEYTCNKLTNAKKIELEYDKAAGQKDKYDRLLAWVYVDGSLLQVNLIREGLAEVAYLYGDYKYVSLLQDEETIAKINKVGKWSEKTYIKETGDDSKEESTIEKKLETKEEDFIDKLLDKTLGKIFEYLNKLIEKIVESIESML